MAGRIRTLKPEFPQSESIGRLSRDARLLLLQLFTLADDEGRMRGASRLLATQLYPYDDDAIGLIDGWLDELERHRKIVRYQVDDSTYLEIPNWAEHQKINRPSPSRLPPPPPCGAESPSPAREEAHGHPAPATHDDEASLHPHEDSLRPHDGFTEPSVRAHGGFTEASVRPHCRTLDHGPWTMDLGPGREGEGERGSGGEGISPPDGGPPLSKPPPRFSKTDLTAAMQAWNDLARQTGLPEAKTLTQRRESQLRARLSECGGASAWLETLAKIRGSPFLLGENQRGWRADFDFVLQAKNFTKLCEGGYDPNAKNRAQPAAKSAAAQRLDAAYQRALANSAAGAGPGGPPAIDGDDLPMLADAEPVWPSAGNAGNGNGDVPGGAGGFHDPPGVGGDA